MLSATKECKEKIKNNSKVVAKGNILFSNGTVLELTGLDFMGNTIGFNHAVSSTTTFDIGSAIIGKMTFTLNNATGKFDPYDFTGSSITPYIGVPLDNSIEWIKKGVYHLEQPSVYGANIALTAYDNMSKFQKPYSEVSTVYPTTVGTIIHDICLHCGVNLKGTSFDNSTYSISVRPNDENMSCLDVIGYISQICGCYAWCDDDGLLEIKWYPKEQLDIVTLNGGRFDTSNPYSTGDNADGGNFIDWSSGDDYDAGFFTQDVPTFNKNFSVSVNTDDVVITGIKVTEVSSGYGNRTIPSTLVGVEGYVLEVSNNPFVERGKTSVIAKYLFEKIGGMVFRPYELQTQSNPLITPGDCCIVQDRYGNTYNSLITNVNYRVGSSLSISCNAESPERHNASYYSSLVKTQTKIENDNRQELSTYDKQVQLMNTLAVNALGYYQTVETDETDNSRITYLHNKSTLEESATIYKMTSEGFFLSTDGGKTYSAGFDSNGNAVLNILSAVGIVCDWIKGGTLTLGGDNDINGSINVLNSNGELIGQLNKDGFFSVSYSDKDGDISSRIKQNAEQISLKVTKGNVSSEISQEAGKISIKSDRFSLSSTNCTIKEDGTIIATNAELNGKITAQSGKIGGFNIGLFSLYTDSQYLGGTGVFVGNSGISCGNNFKVDITGKLTASSVDIYGGEIGGFTIKSDRLYTSTTGILGGGGVFIGNSGISCGSYFKVDSSGNANFYDAVFSNSITVGASYTSQTSIDRGNVSLTGSLTVGGATNLNGNCRLGDGAYDHVGFFGSVGSTKNTVYVIHATSSATASDCATKINEVINALKAYNLM